MRSVWARLRSAIAVSLCAGLVALTPSTAAAQPGRAKHPGVAVSVSSAEARARQAFRAGERLFLEGRYAEALRAYDRGHRLSGRPGFLIDIAHCHVRLGELAEARQAYARFLDEASTSPRADEVKQAVAEIDQQLSPSEPVVPPVARDDESEPPPAAPSSPRDRARWFPAGRAADPPTLDLRSSAVPAPPRTTTWLGPALAGATVGVIVTALYFFTSGHHQHDLTPGSLGTLTR